MSYERLFVRYVRSVEYSSGQSPEEILLLNYALTSCGPVHIYAQYRCSSHISFDCAAGFPHKKKHSTHLTPVYRSLPGLYGLQRPKR